ncbi:MAG: hypothetical protein COT91_00025 [Candidatus Doudnabacteria bacterium CG10_big_fil_rev_8_21_14_0_10_41_10]|uniref:Uncharacterized protein n=1 Tax=Candidatus Doudnabacteria bacterium CG10_big_fil_rev_8_21_14_0_10_41_10 TaxID=1974551 RepID=A0A2H0VF46_9BACT|nr:MAG: hypothetical protein COT91_00025 [Candidatus Doudnabacteria bacterium CG10_big_fil_rev_8_21_14_0_10_41_10]
MDKKFDLFKDLVLKSDLSDEDKFTFVMLFSRSTDEELDVVLKLMKEDLDWVKKMFRNYKMKIEAKISKDSKKWDDILAREKKLLDTV